MECRGVFMLQAQACVFLLLRSGEADGGSTCSSINAQQGDGSNLVAQGIEALGVTALGGELQDILSALVSVLGQGQHNAVAVSQAVSSQVLALVLRAGNVQVQLGDVLAGGVVDSVTRLPQSLLPQSLLPQSLRPQSLQPQSLQPQSLRPQSLQPQSLRPQSLQPQRKRQRKKQRKKRWWKKQNRRKRSYQQPVPEQRQQQQHS